MTSQYLMHCVLRKTLCNTSLVSERGDMDSENHSVVIRRIGSHCEINSIKTGNIDGYIINLHICTFVKYHKCKDNKHINLSLEKFIVKLLIVSLQVKIEHLVCMYREIVYLYVIQEEKYNFSRFLPKNLVLPPVFCDNRNLQLYQDTTLYLYLSLPYFKSRKAFKNIVFPKFKDPRDSRS